MWITLDHLCIFFYSSDSLPILTSSIQILMTKSLLLFTGGIIAANFLFKSKALGTVNFYPDKVRSLDFEGQTPVMVIGLRVQNTTGQRFIIKSVAGNIYSNEYLVGNVSYFTPFTINANSEAVMYVKIRFALIGVVNDIIRAFQTNNFTQQIKFDGYANVDNFQVPIDLEYKIGL